MTVETQSIAEPEMATQAAIVVTPGTDRSFTIDIRGHRLQADRVREQPELERGPQPIEIFVAGLAACVATQAASYLTRHGFDPSALAVAATFTTAHRPERLAEVSIEVTVPPLVPEAGYAPLLAVIRSCTAHNTLVTAPHLDIRLVECRTPAGR